jgi:hypothetical protein
MSETQNLPAQITTTTSRPPSVFSGAEAFESAQRMAKALCASSLVPTDYQGQGGIPNAMIALEMAQRVGASPLAVMQNMHVIEGRPSWSSPFIIASLNSCGRFSALRFEMENLGEETCPYEYWTGPKGQRKKQQGKVELDNLSCQAWAYDSTGEKLVGPAVSLKMAVAEGWYTKNGSKWRTMPELMLRYRAAAFFGRLYAPDILMGMHSDDEVRDIGPQRIHDAAPVLVEEVPEPAAEVKPEPKEKPKKGPEEKPKSKRQSRKKTPEPEPVVEAEIEEPEPEPEPEQEAPPLAPPDEVTPLPEDGETDGEDLF